MEFTFQQFHDLPQIQVADDSPLSSHWSAAYGHQTNYGHSDGTRVIPLHGFDIAIYENTSDMTTMQRYLHGRERSPFKPGYLSTEINHSQTRQFERLPPWPLPEEYPRDASPETIWSASSGSQAPHDELRSTKMIDQYSYETPNAQHILPYPTLEHPDSSMYTPELAVGGGGIDPRDIQYDHDEEAENSIEEYECGLEQEPFVYCKMDVDADRQDSALGDSMRDPESVQPVSRDDDASDSDYKPISAKSRRRRRSSQSSNNSGARPSNKRVNHGRKLSAVSVSDSKVTKKTRSCSGSSKSSNTESNDNNSSTNATRPFACPLAAYACPSTFASKNEWKRHVSTQHIRLGSWRCDLCPTTVDSRNPSTVYYNDFNRKDLFTQHLRRMHAAPSHQSNAAARNNKSYPVTEENVGVHQSRCYRHLRSPPPRSTCLFCGRGFSGPGSWDERMEHVGRHMEKERKAGGNPIDVKDWKEDTILKDWLVIEGLIEQNRDGGWQLGDGRPRRLFADDEDEESDSDYDETEPTRAIKLEA